MIERKYYLPVLMLIVGFGGALILSATAQPETCVRSDFPMDITDWAIRGYALLALIGCVHITYLLYKKSG